MIRCAIKSMQSNKPGNPFPSPGQRQGPSIPGWCIHYPILFLLTRSSTLGSKAVLLHHLGNCSIATRVVILLYGCFLATEFLTVHIPQLPRVRHPTASCSGHPFLKCTVTFSGSVWQSGPTPPEVKTVLDTLPPMTTQPQCTSLCDIPKYSVNPRKSWIQILETRWCEHSDYPGVFKILKSHCKKVESNYTAGGKGEGAVVSFTNCLSEEKTEKM